MTSEFGKPQISDGPTKKKANPAKKVATMIVKRLSIDYGTNCTATLAGM